jgi:PD-(D/E)XK nuclease superfamily
MSNYQEALSFSRRYKWLQCRQSYYYSYVEKLKTKPTDMSTETWQNFCRGTLIHKAIECVFRGEPWAKGIQDVRAREERSGMTDERRKMLPEMEASAKIVADSVLEFLNWQDWEPLIIDGEPAIELKVTAPLPGFPGGFLGFIDLVARHKPTNTAWIVDWKSRGNFAQADTGRFDLQLAAYQQCLRKRGIDVHGTALLEVKPEPPKRKPRYTRDDSGSFLTVRESENGAIRWTPTFRPPELLDSLWANLEREAASIWKAQNDPAEIYVNTSAFNCNSCKFQRLCMAKLNGEDSQFVQESSFEVTE